MTTTAETRPLARRTKRTASLLAAGLTMGALALSSPLHPVTASADTAPPVAGTPVTASTDVLPTAQINGVAKVQVVVGNTVFVGGDFSKARPAGAAPGTSEVSRTNLMAYDIRTGVMTSFAPVLDGRVNGLAASPDGRTLYVVGKFGTVNNTPRTRLAAFDIATGKLTSLSVTLTGEQLAVASTGTTLYVGGYASKVGNVGRNGAFALDVATSKLLGWAPTLTNGAVTGIALSPDKSKVVLVGGFDTTNGNDNTGPYGGLGLAMLDATTAASLRVPAAAVIRDGGSASGLTSVAPAADGFYLSGYDFSSTTGNFEGSARLDWNGNLVWMEDCHGDTYSVWPAGDQVYTASHAHTCANLPGGSFPETTPRSNHHGLVFTAARTGVLSANQSGGNYADFAGKPAPTRLHWHPNFSIGSYTGQSQAAWTVSGNADYVVYGGEFPKVNGIAQQGLVRFPRTGAANKSGPRQAGTAWTTPVASVAKGEVRLSWPANDDRDNARLTYELLRDGKVVSTQSALSTYWAHPNMSYTDTAVVSGTTYRYQVRVSDPFANSTLSGVVSATASDASAAPTSYTRAALADGPSSLWSFDEKSGTTAADATGNDPASGKATRAVSSTSKSKQGTAYRFAGKSGSFVSTAKQQQAPRTFTVEAWVKTKSTKAGKVIGFGNAASGDSTSYDRQVYLANNGVVRFGVYANARRTLTGPKIADGKWHHVVATLDDGGAKLYVDAKLVASDKAMTRAQERLNGYWRVGGDKIGASWPGATDSGYLSADIDSPAVYPVALSASRVSAHYQAGRA